MIDINTIASGSTGNAYHVTDGRSPVLIDPGIQFKKIQKAINYQVSKLVCFLCTHEHGDHSKAVKDLLKYAVPGYMTRGTAEALKLRNHHLNLIAPLQPFTAGSWTILPFPVNHDASEPVGFLMQSREDKLLYVTDSYYLKYKFTRLKYIMIECNYDINILQKNDLPLSHKKRVVQSHFSLENVKTFLKANDLSKVVEIHLLHLSNDNSDADRFQREIEALTGKPVYIGG